MDLAQVSFTGAVLFALGACVSLDGLASRAGDKGSDDAPPAKGGGGGASSSGGGSTSGGASSGSSTSGGGGAPDAAAAPDCPGKAYPSGVRVGTYCVDATEVTNAHYILFLADVGDTPAAGSQPAECAFNTTLVPNELFSGPPMFPVVQVNWCQAYAYCKWAGKRLCGAIGGGTVSATTTAWKDASKDQWFHACTYGGTRAYPYGATYNSSACNGSDVSTNQDATAVMAYSKCEGGYAGVFDMSGNVREWEDSCDGTTGAGDHCRTRGGAADNGELHLTCDHDESYGRDYTSARTGFRCCAE
jgi:formylglycine-generating enzyme required for sulfatase activity